MTGREVIITFNTKRAFSFLTDSNYNNLWRVTQGSQNLVDSIWQCMIWLLLNLFVYFAVLEADKFIFHLYICKAIGVRWSSSTVYSGGYWEMGNFMLALFDIKRQIYGDLFPMNNFCKWLYRTLHGSIFNIQHQDLHLDMKIWLLLLS